MNAQSDLIKLCDAMLKAAFYFACPVEGAWWANLKALAK